MTHDQVIQDVPENEVAGTVRDYINSEAVFISVARQPDGRWMMVVKFQSP